MISSIADDPMDNDDLSIQQSKLFDTVERGGGGGRIKWSSRVERC
uniref:Uncharacterized protein n=1 Tax=Heterorhabditis bacteriophora TaxID=37862 RepID=A0A1I7WDK1_HETBA